MNILFDSHTHSNFSHDSISTIDEMAQACAEKGIHGFALTDHADIGFWHRSDIPKTFKDSLQKVREAQEKYKGKVEITFGIEMGEVLWNQKEAGQLLRDLPFDFIIHSLHVLRGREDFYLLDYPSFSPEDTRAMMEQYFAEYTMEIKNGGGDVAGHLTLPLRYLKLGIGLELDLSPYKEQMDELLKTIVNKDMGIEINTSGYRTQHGDPMPSLEIAKRFRELGGEIVTVGSDAHQADYIGANLKEGMALLKEAGYRYFSVFRNRKPHFYLL